MALLIGATLLGVAPAACAQNNDTNITDAREAFRKKDRARLTVTRAVALAANHPLAMWPDYWELTNRIGEVQQAEVTSSRHAGRAPTSKTASATTGCWSWANAATGSTSPPSSRAFA